MDLVSVLQEKTKKSNNVRLKIKYTKNMSTPSFSSCNQVQKKNKKRLINQTTDNIKISKKLYSDKLYGFWLGECIANWTGLVTEMDKIGNIGEIKTGDFYTRKDWGKKDSSSIWGNGVPSDLSPTIDFVLRNSSFFYFKLKM